MTVGCLSCAFIKIYKNIKNEIIEFKQSITVSCLFQNSSKSSCVFELLMVFSKVETCTTDGIKHEGALLNRLILSTFASTPVLYSLPEPLH